MMPSLCVTKRMLKKRMVRSGWMHPCFGGVVDYMGLFGYFVVVCGFGLIGGGGRVGYYRHLSVDTMGSHITIVRVALGNHMLGHWSSWSSWDSTTNSGIYSPTQHNTHSGTVSGTPNPQCQHPKWRKRAPTYRPMATYKVCNGNTESKRW